MNGCVRVPRSAACGIFLCAALAACGGGGAGGGATPATNPPSTATPTPVTTSTPSTTNATGTLVNDTNGAPLAGVTVKLMPWAPCGPTPSPSTSITPENDGCPTPLPSPQATTAADGTFTLNGAPNGQYLLVIGTDAVSTPPPGYTVPSCVVGCPTATPTPAAYDVTATVHDNVTLTGGTQALKAPTLPTITGYIAPAWETNGDYRLATLDLETEVPCYSAWEYQRAQHGLSGSSVDEWLTENMRAATTSLEANTTNTVGQANLLSSQVLTAPGGSYTSTCDILIGASVFTSANPLIMDPRTMWFGANYGFYTRQGTNFVQRTGPAEYIIDPRSYTDLNHPVWP